MMLYGIPRRKGKYDGLTDNDPVSIEPDNQVVLVLATIFNIVTRPFIWVAAMIYRYVKCCYDDAYAFIKRWNYKQYANRKR